MIEELKLLYVPVPKAACTTLMWLMSDLCGTPRERFERTQRAVVEPAQAIHDMRLWDAGRRLADYSGAERERVLTDPGWLRFTVVRDPALRLWSAWQSKLLMRDPRFKRRFGGQPWFPRVRDRPDQVLQDFRRFVVAAAGRINRDDTRDVHWGSQRRLLEGLDLGHVGAVEDLDTTLEVVRAHTGVAVGDTGDLPWENRTLLPYSPVIYDESSAAALGERFGDDYECYGYQPLRPAYTEEYEQWALRVETYLPAIHELISRHERIAAMQRVSRDQSAESRDLAWELDRAQRRIKKLSTRLEARTRERDKLRARLGARTHQRHTLRARLQARTSERDALRARLDAVHASTSWRLTAPLRWAGAGLKRVRGRR